MTKQQNPRRIKIGSALQKTLKKGGINSSLSNCRKLNIVSPSPMIRGKVAAVRLTDEGCYLGANCLRILVKREMIE